MVRRNPFCKADRQACEIEYNIAGLNDPVEGLPKVKILCQNMKTQKWRAVELGDAVNGHHTYSMNGLEPGEYALEFRMYDDCHRATNIGISTYPIIHFYIHDLELSHYKVEDDPLYSNGNVNFKLEVFLKGSEDGLKDVREYGYYIRYANNMDYHRVYNLSSIFESTPLTLDLPISKEQFFYIDYDSYVAVAQEHFIGAYIVNKNGNIEMYDEQAIEKLAYTQKPSVTFTDAGIMGTYSARNPNYRYETQYKFECEAKGVFWFKESNNMQYTFNTSNIINNWNRETRTKDGSFRHSGCYIEYDTFINHTCYYNIYLANGKTIRSTNQLVFNKSGNEITATINSGNQQNRARRVTEEPQTPTGKKISSHME